ncbi:unnamed protein product [Polarella glacialis]|uniref:Uncharacterized protein n=1 Tax=Polarella glacialis TaxID=89957 RepID=A0A813GXE2_POLGL|nr:unnamed protein product [Polarella glacialis]
MGLCGSSPGGPSNVHFDEYVETPPSMKGKVVARTASGRFAQGYYDAEGGQGPPEVRLPPYEGAKPIVLKKSKIAAAAEADKATRFVCKTLQQVIKDSKQVLVVLGYDASRNQACKDLMWVAEDNVSEAACKGAPVQVNMGTDWVHTFPHLQRMELPDPGERLMVYIGTPAKYLGKCLRSNLPAKLDAAYRKAQLVIVCKGACMLPIGPQEQNVLGIDEEKVAAAILESVGAKGKVVWGHGKGSKQDLMVQAFDRCGNRKVAEPPKALKLSAEHSGNDIGFYHLASYAKYLNELKLANPTLPMANYYDTGLLVSVMMGFIVDSGVSLMTDGDGLRMLSDASIGHTISKVNQLVTVSHYASTRGIYNCFIGDGACRLNGGVELACHLMEGKQHVSMVNLVIFNNHKWAIEDNLVDDAEQEHVLYDKTFYDLIASHPNVAVCENELQLQAALVSLSEKSIKYAAGLEPGGMNLIVVRGLDIKVPPVLGDLEPIRKSPEMAFMRDVLGKFAAGCEQKVPIYGCSAFEFIQFLHIFMGEMPEARKYEYICGRTDIQAAHMCGFEQPDGKCVLFINDVYGINSLGESLRSILSGFGGKQVLVMVWHPSISSVIDNFNMRRPPMVWPSMGIELASYFVRSEKDALFVEWEGQRTAGKVGEAITAKTPLIMVSMMPEHERDYVALEIRASSH